MKLNTLVLTVSLGVFAGCATQSQNREPIPLHMAANTLAIVPQGTEVNVTVVPSHGALPDKALIAAGGGGNAKQVRTTLKEIMNSGGGALVVASENPEVAKAVILGALRNSDIRFENVWLIYGGTLEYSDSVREVVESHGLNYGFTTVAPD